jgi:hypothetical protein
VREIRLPASVKVKTIAVPSQHNEDEVKSRGNLSTNCLSGQRVFVAPEILRDVPLDFRWFFLYQVEHPESFRGQKEHGSKKRTT